MDRDQATRFIHDLLKLLISKKGSDLFLTAEFPPAFKVDGRVTPVSNQPLTAQLNGRTLRIAPAPPSAGEGRIDKQSLAGTEEGEMDRRVVRLEQARSAALPKGAAKGV